MLLAEMSSIASWDGTITSTEFHNAASTFAEIWNNFDLGFPHWSWINPPNKPGFAATKVHLSAFTSTLFQLSSFHIFYTLFVFCNFSRYKDIYPWRIWFFPYPLRFISSVHLFLRVYVPLTLCSFPFFLFFSLIGRMWSCWNRRIVLLCPRCI